MRNGFIGLLWLGLSFGTGCDSAEFKNHDPELVVESYLVANEALGQVRVSRSANVIGRYDFTSNAVTGAVIQVSLLSVEGSAEEVYRFRSFEQEPGVYRPVDPVIVQPRRSYRLEVTVPGSSRAVVATTLVPGEFVLLRANADTIQYQAAVQLELDVTRSIYPGRQSIYIFSTESLDPRAELITPFYKDIVGGDEDDVEDLRITESPIINEGNYDVNPDETLTIKLPWIAVAFYGPNRLTANALDDNLYDFIRSQTVQQGGSTLSPGEIPNVIVNIEGGIGVFGSYARSSYEVFITQ